MLLNCGVGEDSWEYLGLQGDPLAHLKEDESQVFIGRTDVEAETNTLATWCKEITRWKRPWWWKDWRQEENGMTEDGMVGWHHQHDGHELAPEVSDGQGSLACCSPWGHKELDMTEPLNWLTEQVPTSGCTHNGNFILLENPSKKWQNEFFHPNWISL